MHRGYLPILLLLSFVPLISGCRTGSSSGNKELFDKGMAYFYSGDFSNAESTLKKISSSSRYFKRSSIARAKSLYLLGRNREAIGILKNALKRYPDYADALYWAGKINFFNGDFKKAEAYLLRCTTVGSTNADALYILGEIYRSGKDYDKALMYFNEVEQLIDVVALSKIRKAQILLDSGQKEKAKEEIEFVKRNISQMNEGVKSLFVKIASRYGLKDLSNENY